MATRDSLTFENGEADNRYQVVVYRAPVVLQTLLSPGVIWLRGETRSPSISR